MKVSSPSNKLLSKASIVLFVITLKLVADNSSHQSLTFPINVPISIWVSVFGFQLVFDSNKFVLSKSRMYVRKGYMSGSMWKIDALTIIKLEMNKASSSTYILEASNLWHGRLGHVNYDTLSKLISLNHIPTFQIDAKHKCETWVEAKLTQSSFQSVERHTEPLDLIHSDICDLKLVQTRGGNKYFITFVDDSTKYFYVYLLKSKDEAIKKFVLYKN